MQIACVSLMATTQHISRNSYKSAGLLGITAKRIISSPNVHLNGSRVPKCQTLNPYLHLLLRNSPAQLNSLGTKQFTDSGTLGLISVKLRDLELNISA